VKRHISAYVLSANPTTMHRRAGLEMDRHDMTNSAQPKVFVLILSYNGKKWLEECLPSVLAMDYPNYEVVVIDNGSSDGTAEYLESEFPEVQTVAINPNVGYARGFNAGLEYAAAHGAEYFLIMNNDTVIDRGALVALLETAVAKERAGFVTGKVYFYDSPAVLQTVGKYEDRILVNGRHIGWGEKDVGQYESVSERVFADDVFTLVNRKMYDEVGGYDPQFFLQCEEWDWQVRAKKKGWRIYYTPAAKIWHRVSATTGGYGSPINEYFFQRNRMVVLAKHGGIRRLVRYFAWESYYVLKGFLRPLLQFNWTELKLMLALLLGFLAGTLWLATRRPAIRVPWLIQRLTDE
jgi:GT2 family glycosyltransferase